ncbi:hypothetical protein EUGRSUZ_J00404 [Eucalyptus grandis]|uniref:Uncharacterized protein n=1 Tax=Eucalyptus grandis TaxID=71139 RepID=A0ACC3J3C1_EUCGR|nr:hypothetical protein EUGRSUZ_J00404 [Eucalyptus grandis]
MTLSWLSFIISFILSIALISGQKLYSPRLSLRREDILRDPKHHFNYRPESYSTFKQKYLINYKYWGGANSNAPIFVYLGNESPLDDQLTVIGFLTDNAAQFEALSVYIEHRYYGESIPHGMSLEEALKDANIRGYFSSAQALADFAAIIMHVKQDLKARDSPVIVVGASYGGMLASWFRLKYPHVTLGALASSAPILYFDDIISQDAYSSVVTKDFKEASETCYQAIGDSWSEINRIAQNPNGTSKLSKMFKTCKPLESGDELKDYLISMYEGAAQYDLPPTYPASVICNAIDGANTTENGILGKVFAGVIAYNTNSACYVNPPTAISQSSLGWGWQRCSEMVMPKGVTNNSMFQPDPFILSSFTDECNHQYGVVPRPHWITTYYGAHDIELILCRFGSNIIFSNGLRDPFSSAGVLKNISDSIVAVYTEKGAHCLDVYAEDQSDPDWLVMQRKN